MITQHFGRTELRKRLARLPGILYVAGVIALIASLQAWLFERQLQHRMEVSFTQLTALQHEAVSNRVVDLALSDLQEYWRLSRDDNNRRQILELRDSVVSGFHDKPASTIDEFSDGVTALPADSKPQEEALRKVKHQVDSLLQIYQDHPLTAVRYFSSPPWYLQPTAFFLTRNPNTERALRFNHALYLVHAKELARADELLHGIRLGKDNSALDARRLLALARLQFETYEAGGEPAPLSDALQYARQSVQADANYSLAKLFLAYLLTIDMQSARVDAPTEKGEGSGVGEGERGAINADTGEF